MNPSDKTALRKTQLALTPSVNIKELEKEIDNCLGCNHNKKIVKLGLIKKGDLAGNLCYEHHGKYLFELGREQREKEILDIIKSRIDNQLRIHWKWLKNKKDYKEIVDFIFALIDNNLKKDVKGG